MVVQRISSSDLGSIAVRRVMLLSITTSTAVHYGPRQWQYILHPNKRVRQSYILLFTFDGFTFATLYGPQYIQYHAVSLQI